MIHYSKYHRARAIFEKSLALTKVIVVVWKLLFTVMAIYIIRLLAEHFQ